MLLYITETIKLSSFLSCFNIYNNLKNNKSRLILFPTLLNGPFLHSEGRSSNFEMTTSPQSESSDGGINGNLQKIPLGRDKGGSIEIWLISLLLMEKHVASIAVPII